MGTRTFYIAVVCIFCAALCSSCGPHMNIQPSIKPFMRSMPSMPAGTVPTRGTLGMLTRNNAQQMPPSADQETLRLGKIYYGYYCIMCHGAKGDGNGPVGQSYTPKPTDLSSTKLSDQELYLRMLTGVGHDPVLSQTVLVDHRWPIVAYVRQFGSVQKKGGR